jgi:hypothetical protein
MRIVQATEAQHRPWKAAAVPSKRLPGSRQMQNQRLSFD